DLHFPGPKRCYRRKGHDAAEAPLDHLVLDGKHREIRSGKVDVNRFAPHIKRKGGVVLNVANSAAVDEIIDRAKFSSLVNKTLDIVGVGHVAGPANRATTERTDGGRGFFSVTGAGGVAECNVGAFARQPQRRRAPNAPRTARDEDNTVGK